MAFPALLALLLAAPAAPHPGDRAVVAALAGTAPGGPRAAAATRPLHGRPYLADPLGEGSGPDADPPFRLDAFDCLTLVETAVALGSSATLEEARRALDDVRYGGPPSLATRHHEVISQWLPANLAKGWIAPWPAPGGAAGSSLLAVEYDAARWARLRRLGRTLPGVPPGRLPAGRFEVAVVPPDAFAALGAALPEGTLAFVVREDRPDRLTSVTHAGLVVAGPGGSRLVRHATSSLGVSRVIEEPLDRFVARQRAASRRPLAGLALFTILDGAPRLRALAAPAPPPPPP